VGRSFLICRIAGVPLRVHWSFLILPILFLYQPLLHIRSSPHLFVPSLIELLLLVAAVVCHECAHAFTGRRFGAAIHGITLLPFGGVTQLSGMPGTPSAQILLSLAGPACNITLAAAAYLLAALPGPLGIYASVFFYWNLVLGLFNLVPAPMLDGGHALRAALGARLGQERGDLWAGRTGIAAAAALIVYGITQDCILVTILGVIAGATSLQLIRQNRFAGYSAQPRVPPSGDFRTWRLPKKELDAEIKRKRTIDRANKEMRQKVDELLKQISEKGIESLSDKDRAFLQAASERLRGQGR